MYGIFEWENRRWVLWHLAPDMNVASEVRDALSRFTRRRYYIYGPGYTSSSRFPIIGFTSAGARRTWGDATSEWFAWHVRDALSQSLWDYTVRTGRATAVDPYTISYLDSRGRQMLTQVSRPWNA